MRAQAQRSSAANSDGSASRGSVAGSRDDATRASSSRSDGSSASSHRRSRLALGTLAAFFALLAFASAAFASKEVVNYFGTASGSGSLGGELNNPRDIAVNRTGTGAPQGTIYIADDNNHRIQRFDRNGRFVSAWGADVIQTGRPGDQVGTNPFEICTVAADCKSGVATGRNGVAAIPPTNETQTVSFNSVGPGFLTGDTFTLGNLPGTCSASTTDPITFNSDAATIRANIQAALEAKCGVGNFSLSSGPNNPIVTFQGAFSGIDVPTMSCATVSGAGTCVITNNTNGAPAVPAVPGTSIANGALDNPQSVAVDGDTGNVYVSDRDNRRISAYDASGNFIASFGWDVVESGVDNAAEFQRLTIDATGGTFTLSFGAGAPTTTNNIAFNASAATVQTELEGLGDIPAGDILVSGPNGGPYVIRFIDTLGNVDQPDIVTDATLLTGGASTATIAEVVKGGQANNYEVCRGGTDDVCQGGSGGAGAGQYGSGSSAGGFGIAVSQPDGNASTGSVFLADTGNRRAGTYGLAGTTFGSFGSSSNFGTNQPTKIAVDSRGIVYATDSNNGAEIDRYDTLNANGGGVGFLASIASPPLLAGNATATAGLAVDPDSDAGGPDTDVLHVLRDPSSGNTVVQQYGPTNKPGLTSAPTAVDDTHASGAGFSTVQGLGLDDVSGRLLVSATNNVSGTGSAHRVYVIDAIPAPVPVLDPIAGIGTTRATFRGTVDPRGGLVSCKFQYSVDQVVWSDVPELGCAGLNLSGAQTVREDVTGLRPGTHYFVRLQIARIFVPGSEVTTALRVFDTDTSLPSVTKVGAIDVQDTSARMVATIDTRNSATGYVFEYGTTPSLGSSTAPIDIGAGSAPTTVSQVVGGLAPDTDYYMRAVATNLTGSTNSSSATFHTRTDPLPLPDNRGYEQVSPVDKNGGDAYSTPGSNGLLPGSGKPGDFYVSTDGNSVGFTATTGFGDSPSQNLFAFGAYSTHRTASGWAPAVRMGTTSCTQGTVLIPGIPNGFAIAHDFNSVVFSRLEGLPECHSDLLDPNAPVRTPAPDSSPAANVYRKNLAGPVAYRLVNPSVGLFGTTPSSPNASYRGSSDDQSHIVFSSTGLQTPDTPTDSNSTDRLFDWQELGTPDCTELSASYNPMLEACLSLISKDPAGNPFTSDMHIPGTAAGGNADYGNGNADAINAISSDGERIFFQGAGADVSICKESRGCRIYMREGNAITHDISQPECSTPCGNGVDSIFQLASPDGEKTLFVSSSRETDSDTAATGDDLFLYTHTADPPNDPNLTDLSIDNEPLDGTAANVQGVVGASEDLETVFFVANGQLVSGATTATGPKLYRWRWNAGSPNLQYLATLDAADAAENWGPSSRPFSDQLRRERHVTQDGETLLLESKAQLDQVADADTDTDVYRWTAGSGFQCVSCQLPGEASGGPSNTGNLGRPAITAVMTITNEMSTAVTDDGMRIFFQTQDALVPQDTNGPCSFDADLSFYPCTDVYEWNDGTVSLITPGDSSGETDVRLIGATPSGSDVFVSTRQPLVGWDQDTNTDIYDVRIGGGFPEPPVTDICEGEACRGGGSSPGTVPGAGSRVLVHAGNQKRANPCAPISNRLKRKLAAAKKAARKGQAGRARALRKQARNLKRRAKRCNRRQAR